MRVRVRVEVRVRVTATERVHSTAACTATLLLPHSTVLYCCVYRCETLLYRGCTSRMTAEESCCTSSTGSLACGHTRIGWVR